MAKKASTTFESIMRDLRDGKFAPVYMLTGDEPYFIDAIADYLEQHVVAPEARDFDQIVLYGRDIKADEHLMAAQQCPMAGMRRLVLVKEAQNIRSYDNLIFYLQHPNPAVVLAFCYKHKKFDKRTKAAQAIEKTGVFFDSKQIYDNQIAAWVSQYAHSRNVDIEPQAADLIAEFVGNNLTQVANAIDKLIIAKPSEANLITADMVSRNTGISKEYNNFELSNAIANRNILRANRIVQYFGNNPKANPLNRTLNVLFNFFVNLMLFHQLKGQKDDLIAAALNINVFFLKDFRIADANYTQDHVIRVIGWLREADMQMKGFDNVGFASDNDVLKELVYKILH